MTKRVYILATLDTKGEEAALVAGRLRELGVPVCIVDTGCLGSPPPTADVSREALFCQAGLSLAEHVERADRGAAVMAAAQAAETLLVRRHAEGDVAGVLALGGSAGATIGATAMRALPIGVPKLIVSTQAAGNVRGYVGFKDIMMLNPVVDIAGVNRISRAVLHEAAAAMAGMALFAAPAPTHDKPVITATMFGVTTLCVDRARQTLEAAGYEVLVFHATGSGGAAMESLIREGLVAGVLDITTTEIADELVGGVLSAGPERLTAAGEMGIPQVVSVGATDMVNFLDFDSVPPRFRDRTLYRHNANVTLMRTTEEENSRIGADIGRKLARAKGPVRVLLPGRGVSAIDRAGEPFDDPRARQALFTAIREHCGLSCGRPSDCNPSVRDASAGNAASMLEIIELDWHINDPQFAAAAAEQLLAMLTPTKAMR